MLKSKGVLTLLLLALSLLPGFLAGQQAPGTKSWRPSRSGMEGGWIPRILVHPDDPTNLVAAAGSAGVFSSFDGGESWESTGRELIGGRGVEFRALERDPGNPSVLYAGTCSGLFRSTDGGRTWALHSQGLPSCAVAIGVDRLTPGTLFIGEAALFRSRDGGISWTQLTVDLGGGLVFSLEVDPNDSDVVYSGQLRGESLVRSLDGGDTWETLIPSEEGDEVWDIAVHPSDSATVYVVFEGVVYRSRDRGSSWVAASPDLADPRIFAVALHPQNPSRLMAANWEDEIFLSSDKGESWQRFPSSPTRVYDLAFDPSSANLVYAGTLSIGAHRSRDGGVNWEPINTGLYDRKVRALAVSDARPAEVFAGTLNGVFRSQDSGRIWQPANAGLVELSISQLRTIPSGSLMAALDSRGGISVRAEDNGAWTPTADPGARITQLEVAATEPPTLYSASFLGGIFRSRDLGTSWSPINEGLSSLQVTSLAADRADPDRASTREHPRVSIQLTTGEITGSPWGLMCTSTNSRSVPKAPRPFMRTIALSEPSGPETGGRPGRR